MEITKNDYSFIRSINATIEEKKSCGFTHELRVKCHASESNQSNYDISQLISDHFDLLCDNYKSDDVYKLCDGGCDTDQEGGWSADAIIESMEYRRIELDGHYFIVIYKIRLGKSCVENY